MTKSLCRCSVLGALPKLAVPDSVLDVETALVSAGESGTGEFPTLLASSLARDSVRLPSRPGVET